MRWTARRLALSIGRTGKGVSRDIGQDEVCAGVVVELVVVHEVDGVGAAVAFLRTRLAQSAVGMLACDAEFHQYWDEVKGRGDSRIAIIQFAVDDDLCVIFDVETIFRNGPQVVRNPEEQEAWDAHRIALWPLFELLLDKAVLKMWFNSGSDVETLLTTAAIFEWADMFPNPPRSCRWHLAAPKKKSKRAQQDPGSQFDAPWEEKKELVLWEKPTAAELHTLLPQPSSRATEMTGCLCASANLDLQSVLLVAFGQTPRKLQNVAGFGFAALLQVLEPMDPSLRVTGSFKDLVKWGQLRWKKRNGIWDDWQNDRDLVGYSVADAIGLAKLCKLFFVPGEQTQQVYDVYIEAWQEMREQQKQAEEERRAEALTKRQETQALAEAGDNRGGAGQGGRSWPRERGRGRGRGRAHVRTIPQPFGRVGEAGAPPPHIMAQAGGHVRPIR